jgi:hypothetical protein
MPDRPRKAEPETPHRDKRCKTCGRAFPWREELARDWDVIRYCSEGCRTRNAATESEAAALEAAILTLLAERGPTKTICPSEAAKLVAAASAGTTRTPPQAVWQPLMEPARAAARRLVAQGRIVITQRGHPVDPATAKGPIRLKLR